jgi:hypothetical protein
VASTSSSSEPEPTLRHRAAKAQRRARLDELAEAKRQLNEELALIHQEDVPMQEQPGEGNEEWRKRRPAAEQPRARAPTPPAQERTRDND